MAGFNNNTSGGLFSGGTEDHDDSVLAERILLVQQVVDVCIERRLSGETLTDEDVAREHPELMPELAEELQHLAVIEKARRRAASSHTTRSAPSSTIGLQPDPPDVFPGYEILGEIHRGGQGVVYRARQSSTGREVAIKVAIRGALATDAELARLEQEVKVLGTLRHPGIVSVIDSGVAVGGSFYYVMDYIEGVPLDAYLESRRAAGRDRHLPIRDMVRLLIEVCDAVQTAHRNGVIHRDIKPRNIRIDREGKPHLLDFGLAKVLESPGTADALTAVGQFVGSLPWASPEQAAGGQAHVDVRSDVYALGVTGYQMLTGCFPYDVEGGAGEVFDRIQHSEPVPPSRHRKTIDRDLETILMTCLRKEPDRRYQAAGELARDLRRYLLDEPIDARRDSTWYVVQKAIRRHRVAFSSMFAMALLVLLSAVALAFLYRGQIAAREAEAVARKEAETTLAFLEATLGAALPGADNARDMTVREALDKAAGRVATRFTQTPRLEAAVRDTIGYTYSKLGFYDEARDHLTRAVMIRKEELGPQDLLTLRSEVRLADVLHDAGRADEAVTQFEATIARLEHLPNDTRRFETRLRTRYALALLRLQRLADAKVQTEQAVEVARTLQDDGMMLSHALHAQGMLARMEGRLDDAEARFRETEAIWRRRLSEDHEDLAGIRLNLASTLLDRGRFAEARALHEQTLSQFVKIYGEEHPNVILCYSNLAGIADRQGDLDQSKVFISKAIELIEKLHGPDSLQLREAQSHLATVLVNKLEYEAAVELRDQIYHAYVERLGPDHLDTLNEQEEYGRIVQAMGRFQEAQAVFESVLSTRRRVMEPDHPIIARTHTNLGSALESQGKFDEAIAAYESSLEVLRQKLEPGDHRFSGVLGMLGRALLQTERYAEAEPLLRECVDIRARHYPGHWIQATAKARLGASLALQGKRDEGRPLMVSALTMLRAMQNRPPELDAKVIQWLIRDCEVAGDAACVDRWNAELPPA